MERFFGILKMKNIFGILALIGNVHRMDVRIHCSRLSESLFSSRLVEWILMDSKSLFPIKVFSIYFSLLFLVN